ncbi:Alcohol dehydrogenase [Operophtera brumata]|uniref:Alcohol dehydrogenase n=1 Tax=Operophtera brumata TaxID=104452 RepID=A0A0L7KXV6_OPEBR|nr:Alcohol dehydrogenase [Operophtera brumata]
MDSGDSPALPKHMTYSKSNVPILGAFIDYVVTSFQYLKNKTFTNAVQLNPKSSRSTLSATFLAAAFNYKTVDVTSALKSAAPNGVDCYFDNVGGEISSLIINQMNDFGRVSVCGSISSYNDANNPTATILQPALNGKQIRVEGFNAGRWYDNWSEAFGELTKWIKNGQLKAREHVTEGFENIYDAFVGMLQGENVGKAVIKI